MKTIAMTVVLALQSPTSPALRRDLAIGDERSEYAFSTIVDVATNARGEIVVVDRSSEAVRMYGPDGRFLRAFGRIGSGPGEFRNPIRVGFRADTLWILDPALGRITYNNAVTGTLVRTESFLDKFPRNTLQSASIGSGSLLPVHVLADGSLVAARSFSQVAMADPNTGPMSTAVVRIAASRIDTIATMRYLPAWTAEAASGRVIGMIQPFSAHDIVALSRDGSWWVVAKRNPADRSELVLRTSTVGGILTERRIPGRVAEATKEEIERAVRFMMIAGARDEDEARRNLIVPRRMPLVDERDVIAGHGGTVWVGIISEAGNKNWCKLEPSRNSPTCYASVLGVRFQDGGPDYIIGVELTALDIPIIVRYRAN